MLESSLLARHARGTDLHSGVCLHNGPMRHFTQMQQPRLREVEELASGHTAA